jgi:hypothetical protein
LFDAAVAWGVLFHLPHEEQRKAMGKIASALKPVGLFLFTSGDQDGDKQGEPMNGVPFHYWSFTIEGYRELVAQNGMTLVDVHRDAGQNTYYLAAKQRMISSMHLLLCPKPTFSTPIQSLQGFPAKSGGAALFRPVCWSSVE